MHDDPGAKAILNSFGAKKFIETTDKDYQTVYTYIKETGLDLSVYNYLNQQ